MIDSPTIESESRTRGGSARAFAAVRDPGYGLLALLVIALVVGAGGVGAAWGNMAVQLGALVLLAMHAGAVGHFARRGPRFLVLLVVASCTLPVLQLVPLPPALWAAMPGRELVSQSLHLAGGRGWFPLSLDSGRTLVAFLGTLAPATVIVLGSGLDAGRLVRIQRILVALGVAIGLFGAIHLFHPEWADFYASERPLPGILVGTFADRNAAALLFVGCLLLLIGLPGAPRSPIGIGLRLAAGAILATCVLLTHSRTGLVLLSAPIGLLAWTLAAHFELRRRSPLVTAGLVAAALAASAIAGAVVLGSGQARTSMARFDEDDGMRAQMREDAAFVARRYWPAGAGMGTFDEVFQVDESLEYVSPRTAGRAHMDYLELAIEAGIVGIVLLLGWAGWIGWSGWRAVRRTGAWPARAAALLLATIAAQSLLSFPLRNQATLCVAAFACVLLARSPVVSPARAARLENRKI